MIAKRIGAALLAIALIVGAWLVRDRVIEDDGSADAGDGDDRGDVLYCASELGDVCRTIAAEYDELDIRIVTAGATLDELGQGAASEAMWLTFEPFPAMVDTLRTTRTLDPLRHTETPLAGSPLVAVVRPDSTDALTGACGNPVDLACLADQPQLSPTFAPIDTAVGTLGVAAAVESYGATDLDDVQFIVWGRRLAQAGAQSLSGGTAIQTIQTRPTFAVAIGADAELAAGQRQAFDVVPADPATTLEVVLMVPDTTDAPSTLAQTLRRELQAAQWQPPDAAGSTLPDPGVILVIRDKWEDLG